MTTTPQPDLESATANPSLTVETGPDPLETAIEAAAWALVESSGAQWCTPSPDTRKHAAAAVRAAAPHIERATLHRLADEWAADRHVPTWIADRIRARAEAVGTEERR